MTKFFSQIASPTGLLWIFLVTTQIVSGIYLSRGIEPPAPYTLLHTIGFLWIIGWWLQKDSQKHGVKWVFDLGFFLTIAWPFIMPYYLFKTRSVRSLLTVLAFVGVYLGAYIIGAALYAVFPL